MPAITVIEPRLLPSCRAVPHGLAIACVAGLIAGCGAEVAGTAAVAGGLAATQARQAQAQQAQVLNQLKSIQDAGAARAASAGD
jgi:hypothetical protein